MTVGGRLTHRGVRIPAAAPLVCYDLVLSTVPVLSDFVNEFEIVVNRMQSIISVISRRVSTNLLVDRVG